MGPKKIEGAKTIVDTSNRSRVVTDVVGDDFMHPESPLCAEKVPPRPSDGHRAARRELSHEPGAWNPKLHFFGRKIQRQKYCPGVGRPGTGLDEASQAATSRHEAPRGARALV